ncbi:MAG: Rpn family recombination-promoting nuclease/putative transposase [Lachnospiraceae bacterium]|nr:Rpn family recombination-promoting nuclease/putative transposase [Lachnospiraceae bacterium]
MARKRKKLKELTIKDNFMFAAVMLEGDNAKRLLELALGIELDHVDISYEKSIVYNPEYKGVRLDVFVKDEKGTHFNVEMQATSQQIEKRARYYQGQIDMELLVSGAEYEALPDSYVLFICDFDPLGIGRYKYTVRQTIEEDSDYDYSDGRHTVFLSTVGTNEEDVPKALVKFLKFVAAEPESSNDDFDDDFVRQLQNSVEKIKKSRDMEARYMLFEEMMKNEYKAGREDGIIEGKREGQLEGRLESIISVLSVRFNISAGLSEKLTSVNDGEKLSQLLTLAATAASAEDFESGLDAVLTNQVESTKIN